MNTGSKLAHPGLSAHSDHANPASPFEQRMLASGRWIWETLWAGRWVLAASALVAAGLVVALELARPRTYTSSATFALQGGGGTPNFAGLAAQFGVAIPSSGGAWQTPEFYAALLTSRELLGTVASKEYCSPCTGSAARRPFADLVQVEDEDPARRAAEALKELRAATSVSLAKTGITTVAVRLEEPAFAQQVITALLDELNRFNVETRQSQAAAERRFAERRLAEVTTELRQAETRLQSFLQANRMFTNSPELTFRRERLTRELELQQQVYSTLAMAYEQAKIDEVRDIPVLTVIDRPNLPLDPDPRGLALKFIFGAVLGGLLGAAFLLVRAARAAAP